MTNTDKSEWILLDTDLTTRKAILPTAQSHLYFELNEPGSGELRIPLGSRAAALISSGMFCQCFYRGQSIGGFFVDNLKETQADQGEHGGRWLSVSGRGALALLEDAVVWNGDSSLSTRKFTSVTKASMLIDLINEAKARGGLANLTVDFTAALDSSSASWTDSEDYTLNVGTSLLDVLREFAKTGIDFDINLSGGSFVLSAYQGDLGTDLSETIYFRTGVNCEEVTKDERGDEIKNAILAKYRDGYISVTDPTSIAARRRREKLENVEVAQTAASATTFASAKVSTTKDPQLGIAVRVFDGVGPRLFVDYSLGDYIMLDVLGTETRYRALGIQADFDGDQFSNVVVEFNTLLYDKDMRMAHDLDSLIKSWIAAQTNNLIQVSFWSILSNAGKVWDMFEYGGDIYLGGELYINSVASQGTAKYNIATGTWYALGDSRTFAITSIAEMGGNIYLGEDYGGTNPRVMRLDDFGGGSFFWVQLGIWDFNTGQDGQITKMLGDGTNLYVATTGPNPTTIVPPVSVTIYRHVAKWNGSVWSSVGSISDGTTGCNDLAIYNGNLHGAFDSSTDGGLQVFSGGVWSHIALPSLSGRNVQAIAVSGGNLVIASDNKIGVWDGVSADLGWIGTLSGGSSIAYTIETFLSDIYIGGNFTTVDGVAGYNYVAKYSGGAWSKLGNPGHTGVNNLVHQLLFTGDDLYVGGEFTAAGDKATTGLTAYTTDFQTVPDYLAGAGMFDMAQAIHNATASAVSDGDELGFWEDVSNALRKITWANIKATLKTYFDGLYSLLGHAHTAAELAATIHAAADVTPQGADVVPIWQDSSGLLKSFNFGDILGLITSGIAGASAFIIIDGAKDCSGNPNYPSATRGNVLVVSVAGKIGGSSGRSVDVGDVVFALQSNAGGSEASVGTAWGTLEHNLVGALLAANNLSDLASASTARTNLGLGAAAITDTSGWVSASQAWTYASADDPVYQIYVAGNVTANADYKLGNKVKCTNNSTTFYGFIVKVGAYDSGNNRTPVDLYGGTDYDLANSAITAPNISKVKSPDGFPLNPDKWTVSTITTDTPTKASPTSGTWYGGTGLSPTGPSIDIPIGCWRVFYRAVADVVLTLGAAGNVGMRVTLSTANNSESDAEFTSAITNTLPATTVTQRGTYSAEKIVLLTTKTTHYLNLFTGNGSVTNILMNPSAVFKNVIKAVCAYL